MKMGSGAGWNGTVRAPGCLCSRKTKRRRGRSYGKWCKGSRGNEWGDDEEYRHSERSENLSSAETQGIPHSETPFGTTKRTPLWALERRFLPKKSKNSFAFTEFGVGDVVDSRRYALPGMQDGISRRNEGLQPVWC